MSKLAVMAEATLESAPQFIIQLYAMVVQQHSVSIVQMVSLPVSFLSLAWASTVADDVLPKVTDFNVKNKLLLFSMLRNLVHRKLLLVGDYFDLTMLGDDDMI